MIFIGADGGADLIDVDGGTAVDSDCRRPGGGGGPPAPLPNDGGFVIDVTGALGRLPIGPPALGGMTAVLGPVPALDVFDPSISGALLSFIFALAGFNFVPLHISLRSACFPGCCFGTEAAAGAGGGGGGGGIFNQSDRNLSTIILTAEQVLYILSIFIN